MLDDKVLLGSTVSGNGGETAKKDCECEREKNLYVKLIALDWKGYVI